MQNGHAIDSTVVAIEDIVQGAVTEQNAMVKNGHDPAPCPQTIAKRRMDELLGQASDHAVEDLRQLRDDVDATIRAIQNRQKEVRNYFSDHVDSVIAAIKFREIAAGHLADVRERFARGL